MNIDFVFKIAAIGIIVAVLNQLLIRSGREEQAMMTTLAGLIVVLMMIISQISVLFDTIKDLFALLPAMDIFKVLGFCLCALVLLSVLRQYNPGYAVLAALACCMVLLWFVMQALGPVLSFVETLSQFSGFEHLGTVFKAVAIALMAQSVQDLCMEAGQTALAGRVELAGKVAVLLAAMPLFTVLTDTLLALLR